MIFAGTSGVSNRRRLSIQIPGLLLAVSVLGATTSAQAFSLVPGSESAILTADRLLGSTLKLSPGSQANALPLINQLAPLLTRYPEHYSSSNSTHELTGGAAEGSSFSEAFSFAGLRSTEVQVAVNVITFVHDAMEDIEVAQSSLNFSNDNLAPSSSSLVQSQGASGASQPSGSDSLTKLRKMGSGRITGSTSPADAFTRTQRDSEAEEHRLEARDAAIAQQLQAASNATDGSAASPNSASSTFDPANQELGYAQYYQDVASSSEGESGGSIVVNIGLLLLTMAACKFGLRFVLPRSSS